MAAQNTEGVSSDKFQYMMEGVMPAGAGELRLQTIHHLGHLVGSQSHVMPRPVLGPENFRG